jgi:phosphoribosyl 1,2-cyclic phosphodiesterase
MKVCILGSGSKGNAVYVEAGATRLLFDAGFSARELQRRLLAAGLDPGGIQAVVISHEHSDHVTGLRVLGKRLPVYATPGTLDALRDRFELRATETIGVGDWVDIGDLRFLPLPVSHDAADPVCFLIEDGSSRAALVTDLGVVTRALLHRLTDLSLAVIEANHDPDMLLNGPYSWDLKQRIKSRHGHLSNPESAALAAAIAHNGLRHLYLAHLSEINNTPELARREVADRCGGARLHVCAQHAPAPMIRV